MYNPYSNVLNWENVKLIQSCNHMHINYQNQLDYAYSQGIRHFAVTKYHPSEIRYPISDFFTIKDDVLSSPNTEHYNCSNEVPAMHISSPGSLFASGDGVNNTFEWLFDRIAENWQYADGGCIVINHPYNSKLRIEQITKMLDYSDYVVGIEAYNEVSNGVQGDSFLMWDNILKTGRKCFGFMTPDHSAERLAPWRGRIILICNEETEHDCLRCYREGRFFGSDNGRTDLLSFTKIECDENKIKISCNNLCEIKFISDISNNDNCVKKVSNVNYAEYELTGRETYVRVEANIVGERIYSQPFMFKTKEDVKMFEKLKSKIVLI